MTAARLRIQPPAAEAAAPKQRSRQAGTTLQQPTEAGWDEHLAAACQRPTCTYPSLKTARKPSIGSRHAKRNGRKETHCDQERQCGEEHAEICERQFVACQPLRCLQLAFKSCQ